MNRFAFPANPRPDTVVLQTAKVRISLLTPCLLRLESGHFTDLPTQTVWNRALGCVSYRLEENETACIIATDEVAFHIDLAKGAVTQVILADGTAVTDFTSGNLLGTARTLDMANGAIKLEKGIVSRSGVSVMDDSKSLLLVQDRILPRPKCRDLYYFAYGHDYRRQLKDFFRLTGPVPLIPKFALGNWWSRYRAYTQEEYRSLMQQFMDRKIPITVATIDMDWHWTDVLDRFGKEAAPLKPKCKEEVLYNMMMPGWTGYTWNTELFPDHRELLTWLHDHHFHITLNVHPSQGIRFFESCYEAACRRLGRDPESKELIPFDVTDTKFLEAYFDEAHHPLEDEGVDFWWLDWQQGKHTNIPGLDPLWALNHYHTLDSAREEKRPLILSRYAGLGSHRYPLGFSGDTICTWKSLQFQPYFTSNAANAGYTWWSHDIGGHMKGIQDDELYLRWLQFGVFSPVNRLHSSNSDFMGKEPWQRSWAVEQLAERFLRLRHKLIPFLYSANYQTHTEGTPLCMPMYYVYDCDEAYEAKDQYLFGSQLLVCPITQAMDKKLNLSAVKVWLPEGRWTDIFNGRIYQGGQWVTMHRDLDAIPVLAPAGAIVPMYRNAETNDLSLAQPMEVSLWRGNGSYSLYEDDGETLAYQEGKCSTTRFTMEERDTGLTLTIRPDTGDHGLFAGPRQLILCFRDIEEAEVSIDGGPAAHYRHPRIFVELSSEPVTIRLENTKSLKNPSEQDLRIHLLTRIQGDNDWKRKHFQPDAPLPPALQSAMDELKALWRE